MMTDYIRVFKGDELKHDNDSMISGAMECLLKFADCFEKEDLDGMDACCHFPHYIISGNEVICWEKPGQLSVSFFDALKKKGFSRTVVTRRDAILLSENKVHFKYDYTREAADGSIMSNHENIWIVTMKDGKWGILLRSY